MIPEVASNVTVGERVALSRAGSALLVAKESRQSLGWFYLSFATGYEFRGAIIVWAHGILTAVQRAGELGIDPGGEVLCCPIPRRHLRRVPCEMRHRLLSEDEVRGLLDGKRIGG